MYCPTCEDYIDFREDQQEGVTFFYCISCGTTLDLRYDENYTEGSPGKNQEDDL